MFARGEKEMIKSNQIKKVCPHCSTLNMVHSTTIYYKCCKCGEGVSLTKDTVNRGSMVVVDYGRTGDSMWVEVQDSDGNIYTYWKER
jgi:DNA-directed RNA polymerase subunit RPC12/RpoP